MSDYRIIARSEWGARYANGFGSRAVGSLDKWAHHTVTIAPDLVAPYDDDYQAIRDLEKIGQDRFGGGMSYSFLITPVGLLFEGLGIDRVGAHTAGHNTSSVGVAFVGNYETTVPTQEQMGAAAWLLAHGAGKWWNVPAFTGGHRDVKATACPGQHLYSRLGQINEMAGSGDTGTVLPKPPGSYNEDGSVTLAIDGSRGPATIARWQEVMATPIDGVITPYPAGSLVIKEDQRFLNSVVQAQSIKDLTGASQLSVDGDEGKKTIKVRQFWLYNTTGPKVLGRPAVVSDFDGSFGPESTRLLQHALNGATSGKHRY